LATGIVVADIDLSLVDSVREKMPVAKVNCLQYLYSPTNNNASISIEAILIVCIYLYLFGFSKGSHLTSGKLHLYSHKGIVYLNGSCIYQNKNMGLPYLIILRMMSTMFVTPSVPFYKEQFGKNTQTKKSYFFIKNSKIL
jgi:hypothetical protein